MSHIIEVLGFRRNGIKKDCYTVVIFHIYFLENGGVVGHDETFTNVETRALMSESFFPLPDDDENIFLILGNKIVDRGRGKIFFGELFLGIVKLDKGSGEEKTDKRFLQFLFYFACSIFRLLFFLIFCNFLSFCYH